jgi:hypothetical protein
MGDLNNPSGTLLRGYQIAGFVNVNDGDTSVIVSLPIPGDGKYHPFAQPLGWMTAVDITKTDTGFTIKFQVPAPAGAQVRWVAFF